MSRGDCLRQGHRQQAHWPQKLAVFLPTLLVCIEPGTALHYSDILLRLAVLIGLSLAMALVVIGFGRAAQMFDVLWWRWWGCPRTLEAAALDFFWQRNPPRVRALFADRTWARLVASALLLDFKRRVAATYGLARDFNFRTTGKWSSGWNRRLLADCGGESEEAAERIVRRVWELLSPA
jgi:hypothetical protein